MYRCMILMVGIVRISSIRGMKRRFFFKIIYINEHNLLVYTVGTDRNELLELW